MRSPHRRLDAAAIRYATSRAKGYAQELLQAVRDFEADPNRELRLETALECKSCFYLHRSRVGGAAMTYWTCGVCGKEDLHGSTATPRVCISCAKEHQLCRNCGGDLHMRERRRKFPTPVDPPRPVD